jgi:hypothetical protein
MLYDFDYEPNRIPVLQAVLMIANYYTLDERKHTWHWLGVAVGLAQMLDLHRDPDKSSPNLTIRQRRMRKRLWWSCVVRDRFASLAIGRPLRILKGFTDVPVMMLSDFAEVEGVSRSQEELDIESMFVAMTELCSISEGVWLMHFSTTRPKGDPAEVAECAMRLQRWYDELPLAAKPQELPMWGHCFESRIALHRNVLLQHY